MSHDPTWPFGALEPGAYGAILADPPWSFTVRSVKGLGRSPERHYPTMSLDALRALPVGKLAGRDCMLFMWTTWPHLEAAFALIRAWGFTYKTAAPWVKTTKDGTGVSMGLGYVLRSATEPLLVASRGHPSVGSRKERGVILAPRREHSRKPAEARRLVERLRPGERTCELFAREPWAGHEVWGNETGHFAAAAVGDQIDSAVP
jgi:N6-adenosine-specific RNA methylase IME4